MERWNGGFITAASGGGGEVASKSEDFEEGEVWDTVRAREGSKTRNSNAVRGSPSSAWRLKAANARSVPRAAVDGGGGKSFAAVERAEHQQSSSVPVDHISPEYWSGKKVWNYDACGGDDHHGKHDDDDDDDDNDDEMVPPHEYLARRLANSQIASHSMCEGVGRTLKGRDLSKLRNAILTKTGFIE